jgi:hypothetical protein
MGAHNHRCISALKRQYTTTAATTTTTTTTTNANADAHHQPHK